MAEKWEYHTTFLYADSEHRREFLEGRWPEWRPPRYAAESMIPDLDQLGAEGWELVHMEPVCGVGKNGDVKFTLGACSNAYFCVFKRRRV